jgi:hypothetical protein
MIFVTILCLMIVGEDFFYDPGVLDLLQRIAAVLRY